MDGESELDNSPAERESERSSPRHKEQDSDQTSESSRSGVDQDEREDAQKDDEDDDYDGDNFRYYGFVKSVGDGYGFISCAETKEEYGRDVYLAKSEVPEGGWQIEQILSFCVVLNNRGRPQARDVRLENDFPDVIPKPKRRPVPIDEETRPETPQTPSDVGIERTTSKGFVTSAPPLAPWADIVDEFAEDDNDEDRQSRRPVDAAPPRQAPAPFEGAAQSPELPLKPPKPSWLADIPTDNKDDEDDLGDWGRQRFQQTPQSTSSANTPAATTTPSTSAKGKGWSSSWEGGKAWYPWDAGKGWWDVGKGWPMGWDAGKGWGKGGWDDYSSDGWGKGGWDGMKGWPKDWDDGGKGWTGEWDGKGWPKGSWDAANKGWTLNREGGKGPPAGWDDRSQQPQYQRYSVSGAIRAAIGGGSNGGAVGAVGPIGAVGAPPPVPPTPPAPPPPPPPPPAPRATSEGQTPIDNLRRAVQAPSTTTAIGERPPVPPTPPTPPSAKVSADRPLEPQSNRREPAAGLPLTLLPTSHVSQDSDDEKNGDWRSPIPSSIRKPDPVPTSRALELTVLSNPGNVQDAPWDEQNATHHVKNEKAPESKIFIMREPESQPKSIPAVAEAPSSSPKSSFLAPVFVPAASVPIQSVVNCPMEETDARPSRSLSSTAPVFQPSQPQANAPIVWPADGPPSGYSQPSFQPGGQWSEWNPQSAGNQPTQIPLSTQPVPKSSLNPSAAPFQIKAAATWPAGQEAGCAGAQPAACLGWSMNSDGSYAQQPYQEQGNWSEWWPMQGQDGQGTYQGDMSAPMQPSGARLGSSMSSSAPVFQPTGGVIGAAAGTWPLKEEATHQPWQTGPAQGGHQPAEFGKGGKWSEWTPSGPGDLRLFGAKGASKGSPQDGMPPPPPKPSLAQPPEPPRPPASTDSKSADLLKQLLAGKPPRPGSSTLSTSTTAILNKIRSDSRQQSDVPSYNHDPQDHEDYDYDSRSWRQSDWNKTSSHQYSSHKDREDYEDRHWRSEEWNQSGGKYSSSYHSKQDKHYQEDNNWRPPMHGQRHQGKGKPSSNYYEAEHEDDDRSQWQAPPLRRRQPSVSSSSSASEPEPARRRHVAKGRGAGLSTRQQLRQAAREAREGFRRQQEDSSNIADDGRASVGDEDHEKAAIDKSVLQRLVVGHLKNTGKPNRREARG